jgi:hypothetical protein
MEMEEQVTIVAEVETIDPKQQEALVNQYYEEIDEIAFIRNEESGILKKIKNNRKYIKGENFGENEVKTNLINSTLQSLIPHVYAKSPEITVSVNDKIAGEMTMDVDMYDTPEWKKAFSETLEIVLNHSFRESDTKDIFKNSVRSAKVCSIGWVKVHLEEHAHSTPLATNPLSDTKDNLHIGAGIEHDLEDTDDDLSAERLRQIEKGVYETSEIKITRGLVIDNVDFEDIFIHPSVGRFSNMHKAKRMYQRLWISKEELQGRYPDADLTGVQTHVWGKDKKDYDYLENDATNREMYKRNDRVSPVAVFEVWDKEQNRVHVIVKGVKAPLESYTPEFVGERWYPFFGLAFNQLEDEFQPLTDLEQWIPLQDEYTDTRTKLKKHREMNKPHYLASGLTEKDIRKFTVSEVAEVLSITTDGRPIEQSLQAGVHIPIDPKSYDTAQIMRDLQIVSGLQEADMGGVLKAKTATEASIMNNGRATRISEQRDTLEDFISDISNYASQCFILGCDSDMIRRIAGNGATWYDESFEYHCSPEQRKEKAEHIYNFCNVSVRAGSTGKPDEMEDRQTWIDLLPILQPLIQQIYQLRGAGQDATPMEEMLKETMERFDIKGDIHKYIPQQTAPAMQQQGMQQDQQLSPEQLMAMVGQQ